jgi:hypothetical protein
MVRRPFAAALSGAILAAMVIAAPAGAQQGSGDRGRFIVVLEEGAGPGPIADRVDARQRASVSHVYRDALRGFAARMPQGQAQSLEDDPRVEFVQRDRRVSTPI